MAGPNEWRRNAKVIEIARRLGFRGKGDAIDYLVQHCRGTVQEWIDEFPPEDLAGLLDTVTARAGLRIEEFYDDVALAALCERYVGNGEMAFARVVDEFDEATFALTVRLERPRFGCTHVAVIDCRGRRAHKRWFSIWHEVAHLLVDPQLSLAFRRCTHQSKDPVESAMDAIAGELAFHEKWFGQGPTEVTLASLEVHRKAKAPEASRQAAYGAATAASPIPVVFLVAEPGLRASEIRASRQVDLIAGPALETPLRAIATVQSKGARKVGLLIPKNMRVPETSSIKRVFDRGWPSLDAHTEHADEDLADWVTSKGVRLAARRVRVESGMCGSKVFALVFPIEVENS